MVLITQGLLPADSESQCITLPLYADCDSITDMQWPVLLYIDYKIRVYSSCHGLKIPSSADCRGSDLFEWPAMSSVGLISPHNRSWQISIKGQHISCNESWKQGKTCLIFSEDINLSWLKSSWQILFSGSQRNVRSVHGNVRTHSRTTWMSPSTWRREQQKGNNPEGCQ